MGKLSRPIREMKDHYSAVVVGSGYGGAIAAARIARAGRDVCVLERGREIHPGDYPNTALSAAREIQVETSKSRRGRDTGMFEFHVGPDVTVLTGCGLGGTSLINANVALEPGETVFDDKRWPAELRHRPEVLRPFMRTARTMLGSTPYPRSWPDLPRLRALTRSASSLDRPVTRPPLNVTFTPGPNAAGVRQNACTLCGDCCSGCNYGAKNTVLMNYLPDAYRHGADIFTEVSARAVSKQPDGTWRVDLDTSAGDDGDGPAPESVTADVVVLAAGTLGSSQILLRSREQGLAMSERLGHGFSGNGDVLAFAYDTDTEDAGTGDGEDVPRRGRLSGPTITGMIDLRRPALGDSLIIEDGAVPGALAAVLPLALGIASTDADEPASRRVRELAGIPFGSHRGPTGRTLTYLVMSTDDAGGQMVFENDRVHVTWPGVGGQSAFARDNQILARATRALHGTPVPDPLWAWTHEESLITVHPLGGCTMADDPSAGVVDHKGQVFDPSGGVHDGLYVCDGSVVPLALDVNPLLTISALAERTAALLIADRGWEPGRPARKLAEPPELAPGQASLTFNEHLGGYVSMDVPDGYADGYHRGREDGARVDMHVTITWNDIHAVLQDPAREAVITGTVNASALSPEPLTVTEGRFTLFEPDPARVEAWFMRYRMTLKAQDGKEYVLDGHKDIRNHGARHAWADTTTLYTSVREAGGGEPGTGVLHLKLTDLTRLVRSIKVDGVARHEQGEYRKAFLELFAAELAHIYGGVVDETASFPAAPKPAPAVREPRPPDGTWWCDGNKQWHSGQRLGKDAFLRLTRYRAGDKGPVMLASGFGMSSHSFLAPTIETNMGEFLAEAGYDTWLFDYRAGIDLPSSGTQFTLDDIARTDWPLAVRKVLEETGRDDLQVFGHCVGSGSLLMGLQAGLEGVRAAACAQFPLHPATSVFNLTKSRLHTAGALRRLGAEGLSPDTRLSFSDELLDITLRTLPLPGEERCGQAVCRWINAVYGMTHRHDQLNEATHRALNSMFGFGNIDSLDHLGLMMRKGQAVTHTGGTDYLDHPERIAGTSLLLLQGTQNYIFHPVGSLKTLRWLRHWNPAGDYHREVLPGYAHLDAIVGSAAAADVYPRITKFLDER